MKLFFYMYFLDKRMTTKYLFLLTVSFVMCLTSCKTTSTMRTTAPYGTKFYATPWMGEVKELEGGGPLLKVSDEDYIPIAFAQLPGKERKIPFGIDISKNKHTGATLASIPLCFTPGLQLFTMWISLSRTSQTTHTYDFSYDKHQSANFNVYTDQLLNPDPPKLWKPKNRFAGASSYSSSSRADNSQPKAETNFYFNTSSSPVASTPSASSTSSSTVAKSDITPNVSRSFLPDLAEKFAGTYQSHGVVSQNGRIVTEFEKISIHIKRASKNIVKVNIIEGGVPFFDAYSSYNVQPDDKGGYAMTPINGDASIITVRADGELEYWNPQVVNSEGTFGVRVTYSPNKELKTTAPSLDTHLEGSRWELLTHTVAKDETLGEIATKYGTDLDEIIDYNELGRNAKAATKLPAGTQLYINVLVK